MRGAYGQDIGTHKVVSRSKNYTEEEIVSIDLGFKRIAKSGEAGVQTDFRKHN